MLSHNCTEGEQGYSLLHGFYWHQQDTGIYGTKNRKTGVDSFVGGHMFSIT